MLRRSKECVINLPTLDLVDKVVGNANFECRLRDTRMIRTYGLFIWEVVKAR
jgi:flavin reductase (DIM6/NTAB) family NADH-FMN oxidoreductase RutF